MQDNVYKKQDKNGKYIVEEFISGDPDKLIICVHGFGVNRGDGGDMFFDIARNQQNAVVVLVDLNSPDEQSNMLKVNNFSDQYSRLEEVIKGFKLKYPDLPLSLIGHSMGCALIAKNKIPADQKLIFLTPAFGNVSAKLKPMLMVREESYYDEAGKQIVAKRSDGSFTLVPDSFFEEIKNETWSERYEDYLQIQPDVDLIIAGEDEILKSETKNIIKLKFNSVQVIEGADHNFLGKSRAEMLEVVSQTIPS